MTALRAHSPYRLSPAAGHHARASSETAAWPGLYEGPSSEEILAEIASKQRRSAKRSSEYIPHFAASGWTDGSNDPGHHKLPPHKKPLRKVASQAIQRIPSVLHLHHSRSNPHMRDDATPYNPTSESSPTFVRHSSSHPCIASHSGHHFHIPEIHLASATPHASNKSHGSSTSKMGSEREDVIFALEDGDETQMERRPSTNHVDRLPPTPS